MQVQHVEAVHGRGLVSGGVQAPGELGLGGGGVGQVHALGGVDEGAEGLDHGGPLVLDRGTGGGGGRGGSVPGPRETAGADPLHCPLA